MLAEFFERLFMVVDHFRYRDLLDIGLVWLVIYRALLLVRHSGAVQVILGLALLSGVFLLSKWLELVAFHWVLEKFFNNLILIVVILFQGEIRRALAHIGSTPFLSGISKVEETHLVEELAKSAVQLAQKGVGALIVLEKEIDLEYFVEVGTDLNATISVELLSSVFSSESPLHDGAVLIRSGRVASAGCFLPLSKNPALDKNLGTRHRAAIGLTEETDAVVIVVSEESHSVGLVEGGRLSTNLDLGTLRRELYTVFGLKVKG